jgi:hypothetical protein
MVVRYSEMGGGGGTHHHHPQTQVIQHKIGDVRAVISDFKKSKGMRNVNLGCR